MAQDKPFPNLGGLTYSEDVFFRFFDDLLGAGIVGTTDYQVIQNHLGANMSVDVNPGSAYVLFTSVAGGKRRTRLPAQSNSGTPGTPNSADNWLTTFVAADATNPRVDRVVLTVRDTAIDGSGASDSALRVIAGTPTAGATLANLNGAAAVPANSLLLANVLVPNAATTVTTANIANVAGRATIAAGNLLGPTGAQELAYAEKTTNQTINTVTEAAAATVITAPAVTTDGVTPIIVEFYTPAIAYGGGGILSGINLWQDGVDIGRVYDGTIVGSISANFPFGVVRRKLTPAAGSHTYSIRGWCGATNMVIQCSTGGAGAATPAHIRVVKGI